MEAINELDEQNELDGENEMEVDDEKGEVESSKDGKPLKRKVYLPGEPLKEGEELVYDPTAYVMLHEAHAGCCAVGCTNRDSKGFLMKRFPRDPERRKQWEVKVIRANSYLCEMTGCCAVGCTNRDSKGFLMKRFPRDPERRKQWEVKVSRANWKPTSSSYLCYSCLSFDIVNDGHGIFPEPFPATTYVVAGTQSENQKDNRVIIMKVSNLTKTLRENDSDDSDESSESDDESNLEKKPVMLQSYIKHNGIVNRTRVMSLSEYKIYAGVMSDTGRVSIYDIRPHLQHLDTGSNGPLKGKKGENAHPAFIFEGHESEGYAIDWSPVELGALATGDCKKNIFVWSPTNATWAVNERPLLGHKASVEDIQWSPTEANVLASCSVDRSIRIWDTRQTDKSQLAVEKAHASDINVISWNKDVPLLTSGGDDGVVHVWDLRQFKKGGAVASLKHHKGPITSVEWCPGENSVFASAGEDDQIAIWDLAVEKEEQEDTDLKDLPPQLLFIHQGQSDIKEIHWHPQYPGMVISTANTGFNFFKTISM